MIPCIRWSKGTIRFAERVANIWLAGAGDNSEKHIEMTRLCLHHRRPCTPEEIAQVHAKLLEMENG